MRQRRATWSGLGIVIALILLGAGCAGSSKAAVQVRAAATDGSTVTSPHVTSALISQVGLDNGEVLLAPATSGDATSVSRDEALSRFEGRIPANGLVGQASVFLARFTDVPDSASGDPSSARLTDRLVVVVAGTGKLPAPQFSGYAGPTDGAMLLVIDAATGNTLEFRGRSRRRLTTIARRARRQPSGRSFNRAGGIVHVTTQPLTHLGPVRQAAPKSATRHWRAANSIS